MPDMPTFAELLPGLAVAAFALVGVSVQEWIGDRYTLNRRTWRPVRRWYGKGRIVATTHGLARVRGLWHEDPERTWVWVQPTREDSLPLWLPVELDIVTPVNGRLSPVGWKRAAR